MKYFTAIKGRANDVVVDTVQQDVDYIDSNGDVHIHAKHVEVMVTDKTDLEGLTGYEPNTIAYTAGLNNIWQLSAAGEWVAIIEEEDTTVADDTTVAGEGGE